MLTQVCEISTTEEVFAISTIGVDQIGVLVGHVRFPRELAISAAAEVRKAIVPSSKSSARSLSCDISLIASSVGELDPSIVHLGASAELLFPKLVALLKRRLPRS
jgi:phosphoribosylanthranilate isomerase